MAKKPGFVSNITPGPSQRRRTIPVRQAKLVEMNEAIIYPSAQAPITVSKGKSITTMNATMTTIKSMLNSLPPDVVDSIVSTARSQVIRAFKGVKADKGLNNSSDGYALSKAPSPKPVKLYSGIQPNTYANDYMVSVDQICAPMHVTAVQFAIPTNALATLSGYFSKVVAFDVQTRAQSNVGFDIGASTQFQASYILTAFNAVISALQLYYWYSSIIAYESDARNKNEAMLYLRQNITSDVYSLVLQLGRRLEDTPCPPRILEWIRYASANYYSGDNQGSTLIKIAPDISQLYSPTSTTALSAAIAALGDVNTNTVFTLLRRAVPQWRIGKLFDVPVMPCYDENFKTIFTNLPFYIQRTSVNYPFPSAASLSTNIVYNSFTNKLDGVAYAMAGVYDATNSVFPGLVSARTTGLTGIYNGTRNTWGITGGTNNGWHPSDGDVFLSMSRQDTYQTSNLGTNVYSPHLFGAERCLNVSVNTIIQTTQNVLDFLIDIDSIPSSGSLSGFNQKANGML